MIHGLLIIEHLANKPFPTFACSEQKCKFIRTKIFSSKKIIISNPKTVKLFFN